MSEAGIDRLVARGLARYRARYCEENVWHICAPDLLSGRRAWVIFVSNDEREVAVWHQRAARGEEAPILWDYHVVLWVEPSEGEPGEGLVLDLDSRLPLPCPVRLWLQASFPELREEYARFRPRFRVIEAARYRSALCTDRSHMRRADGHYRAPPPEREPIGQGTNLMRFVDMRRPFLGDVLDLPGLLTRLEAVAPPPLLAFGRPPRRRRLPLCPELECWLLDDALDLEAECRKLSECDPPPYWAFCWGSGQAMARYLLDHPEAVRGRVVVDWGAGCGVAGVAAARAGARRVVCIDTDPDARIACEANARLAGVEIETSLVVPEEADVMLACDVLYEPSSHAWLRERARGGLEVLLSDPLRASSPPIPEAPIAGYAVCTLPDVDSPSTSAVVFRLDPDLSVP